MGGLTAALILAKHGQNVLVLEKNHQIGGALQVFSRDKCVFDTGVHYLGGLDEGENLYKLFKYLDIYDGLKLKRLDDACFDLIRFADGTVVPYGQGYDQFISNLVSAFPEEETAIRTFCAKIVDMCNYFRDNVRKERITSDFRLFSEASRVRVNSILVLLFRFNLLFYRSITENWRS
jgi:all-trans-retinol 13,14-reductase